MNSSRRRVEGWTIQVFPGQLCVMIRARAVLLEGGGPWVWCSGSSAHGAAADVPMDAAMHRIELPVPAGVAVDRSEPPAKAAVTSKLHRIASGARHVGVGSKLRVKSKCCV